MKITFKLLNKIDQQLKNTSKIHYDIDQYRLKVKTLLIVDKYLPHVSIFYQLFAIYYKKWRQLFFFQKRASPALYPTLHLKVARA